jgi:hypothetical protein
LSNSHKIYDLYLNIAIFSQIVHPDNIFCATYFLHRNFVPYKY